MESPQLDILVGVEEHFEQLGGSRQRYGPIFVLEGRFEVPSCRSEVVLSMLGTAQSHEEGALLVGRRRLLEGSTQHPHRHRAGSGLQSDERLVGEERRDALVPRSGRGDQVLGDGAGRLAVGPQQSCRPPVQLTDGDLRHPGLDGPPDQGVHELDGVAVPHDAGRLQPRRLAHSLGRLDPGELGDDGERAAVPEHRGGLGDARGLGAELAEPCGDGPSQGQAAR